MSRIETRQIRWQSCVMACQTKRHRLFVDGRETPFFLDQARTVAHFIQGQPIGLYGSGMGNSVTRRDGSSYRIAAVLGSFQSMRKAKRHAESVVSNLRT